MRCAMPFCNGLGCMHTQITTARVECYPSAAVCSIARILPMCLWGISPGDAPLLGVIYRASVFLAPGIVTRNAQCFILNQMLIKNTEYQAVSGPDLACVVIHKRAGAFLIFDGLPRACELFSRLWRV